MAKRYGMSPEELLEQFAADLTYMLAVDRRFKKDGEETADFIRCVAFGKQGEVAERYLYQGCKIVVIGCIQTGSYTDKDGRKIYTTDVVVEEQHFCESKNENSRDARERNKLGEGDQEFMDIPENIDDEVLFR